jgi:predicted DNA-binding transcriptional regulator YafY
VESTAKGKLPIHPSYLEIKRLLLEHAPSRSGDTEAADAKARLKSAIAPSEEDTRDAEPVARAAAPVVKSRPPLARSALPPLRKAAN